MEALQQWRSDYPNSRFHSRAATILLLSATRSMDGSGLSRPAANGARPSSGLRVELPDGRRRSYQAS